MIILIVAAVVSLLLGEYVDAVAIMVIVVLNAVVGVVQESKAEAALAALKKMAAPNAQVIRGGHQVTIPSRELVPGDIVLIEAGNYVPADMRLVESVNLKVEEASLTGESVPVDKNANVVLDKEIPLGDRKNSAFMSTLVTYGRGKGLGDLHGDAHPDRPDRRNAPVLRGRGHPAAAKAGSAGQDRWASSAWPSAGSSLFTESCGTPISGMIFKEGIMAYLSAEKKDIVDLFMTAVSLAIAAVPEGLPAVVTICLALGMQRMIRRHALIRKLPAVETLGCATRDLFR